MAILAEGAPEALPFLAKSDRQTARSVNIPLHCSRDSTPSPLSGVSYPDMMVRALSQAGFSQFTSPEDVESSRPDHFEDAPTPSQLFNSTRSKGQIKEGLGSSASLQSTVAESLDLDAKSIDEDGRVTMLPEEDFDDEDEFEEAGVFELYEDVTEDLESEYDEKSASACCSPSSEADAFSSRLPLSTLFFSEY